MKQEGDTRTKLLTVAMDLIWENSYGSVSVDDICTRAGVNKGSFYHAFKSKCDLAVAAFERHWESKRPLLDSTFSSQAPPLERLDNYCRLTIADQQQKFKSFGKALGCPFCSIGSELSTQNEKIRLKVEQMGHRMQKYWESLVRDLAAEGAIEAQDPAELAREVMSYVNGVLIQSKIENSLKQVEHLRCGIAKLLGLKASSPAHV